MDRGGLQYIQYFEVGCKYVYSILQYVLLQYMEYFGVIQVFLQEPDNKYSSKCVRISSVTDCYELKCILKEKFTLHRDVNPHRLSLFEVHMNQSKFKTLYNFEVYMDLFSCQVNVY